MVFDRTRIGAGVAFCALAIGVQAFFGPPAVAGQGSDGCYTGTVCIEDGDCRPYRLCRAEDGSYVEMPSQNAAPATTRSPVRPETSANPPTLASHGVPVAQRILSASDYDIYYHYQPAYYGPGSKEFHVVFRIPESEQIFDWKQANDGAWLTGKRFNNLMSDPAQAMVDHLNNTIKTRKPVESWEVSLFVYVDSVHLDYIHSASRPSGAQGESALMEIELFNTTDADGHTVFRQKNALPISTDLQRKTYFSGSEAMNAQRQIGEQKNFNLTWHQKNEQLRLAREAAEAAVWRKVAAKYSLVSLADAGLDTEKMQSETEFRWFKLLFEGADSIDFQEKHLEARLDSGILKALSNSCRSLLPSNSGAFSEKTRTVITQGGVPIRSSISDPDTYFYDPRLKPLVDLYLNDPQYSRGMVMAAKGLYSLTSALIRTNGCDSLAVRQLAENLNRKYERRPSLQVERQGGYGPKPEAGFYTANGRSYYGRWLLANETTSLPPFRSGGRTRTWQDVVAAYARRDKTEKRDDIINMPMRFDGDDGTSYHVLIAKDPITEGDFAERLYIVHYDRKAIADWKHAFIDPLPDIDDRQRPDLLGEFLRELKITRLMEVGYYPNSIWWGRSFDPAERTPDARLRPLDYYEK